MDTIALKMPSFSHTKMLIAALLAAIAIGGAVEAAAPDLASAQKRRDVTYCGMLVEQIAYWEEVGLHETANELFEEFLEKCMPSSEGL